MNELLEIIGKGYVLYAMGVVFGIGILSRFWLSTIYRSLQKDVIKLPTPKKRIVKLIKLKYESCSKLDMQISNTEAFVKNNLREYRVCGISLRAIEKILGQAMFFGVLIGVTAIVFAVKMQMESRIIIVHIATMALLAALLYNYDRLSDIAYKRQAVENSMVDFLENHLQMHLLAQERGETAEQDGKIIDFAGSSRKIEEDKESLEEDASKLLAKRKLQTEGDGEEKEDAIDDNRIIEEVLREFFG